MSPSQIPTAFLQFRNQWNNKGLDFDHAYGFQCMDVVEEWNRFIGHPSPIGGNAIDLPSRAPSHGYIWVKNTPNNFPSRGDIVVFNWGQYGHCGIIGAANVNTLNMFNQNNPIGSICHMTNNNHYGGCLGWLRPN